MITPSGVPSHENYVLMPGRFQPNTRLCFSFSDFHPKEWNPSWQVSTILVGLLSFMVYPRRRLSDGFPDKRRQHSRKYGRNVC